MAEQCMQNYPAICIPRLPSNTTKMQIASVFKQLKWGKINNILIIHNNRKKNIHNNVIPFICVFIYLSWFNDDKSIGVKAKLLDNKCVKIVCDDFTFWKIYAKNGK